MLAVGEGDAVQVGQRAAGDRLPAEAAAGGAEVVAIRDRLLEPGDMVSPQTPVLTLALTDPVWVRAYASEVYLGRLAPGMSAEVSTDSYPDKTYPGWIGFISPTAEFTPKTVETPELRTRLVYQVRVHVCNPQDELRLGMPTTVSIPLDQPRPQPGHASHCTPPGDG